MSVEAALKPFMQPHHVELYNMGTMSGHHAELTDAKYGVWSESTNTKDIYVIVRNPFDKMVSNYFYTRKGSLVWNKGTLSFRDFVAHVATEAQTAHWEAHTKTQSVDFITFEGEIVPHETIRFEQLEQDFDRMATKYELSTSLPVINKSRKDTGTYRDYYDDETKGIVQSLFRDDIEYFGYDF
jgi:hypothetical protein